MDQSINQLRRSFDRDRPIDSRLDRFDLEPITRRQLLLSKRPATGNTAGHAHKLTTHLKKKVTAAPGAACICAAPAFPCSLPLQTFAWCDVLAAGGGPDRMNACLPPGSVLQPAGRIVVGMDMFASFESGWASTICSTSHFPSDWHHSSFNRITQAGAWLGLAERPRRLPRQEGGRCGLGCFLGRGQALAPR